MVASGWQGVEPSTPRLAGKPCDGQPILKMTIAELIVRSELTAEASLAEIRARMRLGIEIAARIRMMPTAIINSMREKPFCLYAGNAVHFVFCADRNVTV